MHFWGYLDSFYSVSNCLSHSHQWTRCATEIRASSHAFKEYLGGPLSLLSLQISYQKSKSLCRTKRTKECAAEGISCAYLIWPKELPRVPSWREKEGEKERREEFSWRNQQWLPTRSVHRTHRGWALGDALLPPQHLGNLQLPSIHLVCNHLFVRMPGFRALGES